MRYIDELIIGIISGLVSSQIITQIYRKVDKKRDRFEYINEIATFAFELYSHMIWSSRAEIEDECIINLSDFIAKIYFPQKKKWVKLKKEEKIVCDSFFAFYEEVSQKAMICRLNIQRADKRKYEKQIIDDKLTICCVMSLKAFEHYEELSKLKGKYINN